MIQFPISRHEEWLHEVGILGPQQGLIGGDRGMEPADSAAHDLPNIGDLERKYNIAMSPSASESPGISSAAMSPPSQLDDKLVMLEQLKAPLSSGPSDLMQCL